MNQIRVCVYIVFVFFASCSSGNGQAKKENEETKPGEITTELITDQLIHPTAFAAPADGSGRLFIGEQEGRIMMVLNGKLSTQPYLDIRDEVIKKEGYDERGLLGIAFHPDFTQNGKFYIYCNMAARPGSGANCRSVIREFTTDPKSNSVDKNSVRNVLEFDQPEFNHNGGDLKFGPDGFLYIAVGDGGGANDQHGQYGNGQNLNTLLGKILRIDINKQPYGIPNDNPFIGQSNARPEIYAYGLRNPWRMSFDRGTGQLFVGDVGQDTYEEVDIVKKGGNYGWRVREGFHPKNTKDPDPKNWLEPIAEYPHSEGISITGGFVYRGKEAPALSGKYVFADWMGPVWTLTNNNKPVWDRQKLPISRNPGYWQVYSFGEDSAGELYILAMLIQSDKGALFKLVQK